MGEFFTNIQVSRGKQRIHRDELTKRIASALSNEGWHEVSAPVSGARRIYVGGGAEDEWLTVLDSVTEGQDPARLDRAAELISELAGSTAISILVHDGDRLELGLFKLGKKLASLDSWPGYFEGEPPSDSTSGLEDWTEVLPPGKSIEDLREAWRLQRVDEGALPRLKRMAQVLGMDPARCATGANTLSPTLQPQFTSLMFASDSTATDHSGLPALGYSGGLEDDTTIGVGESRSLTLIAHSIAGAATGMRVIVWGSALDDKLISVSGASLTIGEVNPPQSIDLANQSGSNEIILTALAAGVEIPAGYGSPGEAFAAADGDMIKGMSRWLATRINLGLDVVAVKPGTGVLSAALQPLANIEQGHAVWTTDVHVDA
jgi:hypothetical protein